MESLPAELARNFTLIKELDQVSHGTLHIYPPLLQVSHRILDVMEGVRTDTDHFLDKVKAMNKEERVQWLQKLSGDFKEALRHGEEKVALASQTYEMVDRHIRRLDEDLARYEEEMMTAPRNQGNRERRPDSYANGYQQYEDPGRKRKDGVILLDLNDLRQCANG